MLFHSGDSDRDHLKAAAHSPQSWTGHRTVDVICIPPGVPGSLQVHSSHTGHTCLLSEATLNSPLAAEGKLVHSDTHSSLPDTREPARCLKATRKVSLKQSLAIGHQPGLGLNADSVVCYCCYASQLAALASPFPIVGNGDDVVLEESVEGLDENSDKTHMKVSTHVLKHSKDKTKHSKN